MCEHSMSKSTSSIKMMQLNKQQKRENRDKKEIQYIQENEEIQNQYMQEIQENQNIYNNSKLTVARGGTRLVSSDVQSDLYLGITYDSEKLDIEFKELCVQRDDLSIEECVKMIKMNYFSDNFHTLIRQTVFDYIDKYLYKYISCYVNAGIDGYLYFGIDDFGEITGIGIKNGMKAEDISEYISSNMDKYLLLINCDIELDIKFEQLKTDIAILEDDIMQYYNDYSKNFRSFNDKKLSYQYEKNEWDRKIRFWSDKLFTLANSTVFRMKLIEFIVESLNENPSKHDKYQSVIQILESDEIICIPPGYQLDIIKTKSYNSNTLENAIVKWVMEFKEAMIRTILKDKPDKLRYDPARAFQFAMYKLSNTRLRMIREGIQFYILKIHIKTIHANENWCAKYRYSERDNWIHRKRINGASGPSCDIVISQ